MKAEKLGHRRKAGARSPRLVDDAAPVHLAFSTLRDRPRSPSVIPSTPARGWRACYGTGTTNRGCPIKALAISMVPGAALSPLVSVPALAKPMSNLASPARDLAL